MKVRPAPVAQVTDFDVDRLVYRRSLDFDSLPLNKFPLLLVSVSHGLFSLVLALEQFLPSASDLSPESKILLDFVLEVSFNPKAVFVVVLDVFLVLESHIGHRVASRPLPLQVLLVLVHGQQLFHGSLSALRHVRLSARQGATSLLFFVKVIALVVLGLLFEFLLQLALLLFGESLLVRGVNSALLWDKELLIDDKPVVFLL